jgi:hypothetical protein
MCSAKSGAIRGDRGFGASSPASRNQPATSAGPGTRLAEETEEEVQQAAELANAAGTILPHRLPDGYDAAGPQRPRDAPHQLLIVVASK